MVCLLQSATLLLLPVAANCVTAAPARERNLGRGGAGQPVTLILMSDVPHGHSLHVTETDHAQQVWWTLCVHLFFTMMQE